MWWWLGKDGFASKGCMFDESVSPWFDREKFPPLAIFAPGKDNLVNPYALIDRIKRCENLKVFEIHIIPHYNHLDIVWAIDVLQTVGLPTSHFIWRNIDQEEKDSKDWKHPPGLTD